MAISPLGSPFLNGRSVVQTTPDAHQSDIAKSLDWNQVFLDQEKSQARASLRPDMAASIRAAQSVWLASQDAKPVSMPDPDTEMDIEAFITMLVEQASEARRGM